jgi:hypothetical protein
LPTLRGATFRAATTAPLHQHSYEQFIAEALAPQDAADLRAHTQQHRVWASDRSPSQIEALTQRATNVGPRGRPSSRDKRT